MKSISYPKLIILSAAVAIAGFFIGQMNLNSLKNNRIVQVKGLSEREVMADLAVWPMQFTITGNDLMAIKRKIEQQTEQTKKFFTDKGFSNAEIIVGATNINDRDSQLYSSGNRRPFRYLAKTDITLRTSDIPKIKAAQKELVNLAARGVLINSKSSWSPVRFSYTKLNEIKPSMIEEATKKAKEVAEKFASDSNSKVGKIKNAYQGIFSINSRDENSPEIKSVRVVTTIIYFLED